MPGCVKEIIPTMITLNSGLRYHRVNRETGLGIVSSTVPTSGSTCLDDISQRFRSIGLTSKNGKKASGRHGFNRQVTNLESENDTRKN